MSPIHSSSLLLLLNLSLLVSSSLSSFSSPSPEPESDPKYTTFIKDACNTTTYPSLCQNTFLPHAAEVKGDDRKLAAVALSTTMSAAQSSAEVVAKLAEQSSNLTKYEVNAIKDCVETIGDSIEDLKQSIEEIDGLESSSLSPEMKFRISNIQTYMSAAISNENTCMDGVSENKVSPYLKRKIRGAILGLLRLTSNTLALCNHLQH